MSRPAQHALPAQHGQAKIMWQPAQHAMPAQRSQAATREQIWASGAACDALVQTFISQAGFDWP